MVSNTRTLSPSVVNEFRFGATKFYNNLAQELQYKRNVHEEVGLGLFIPPPISWGLPSMSISGFSGFGDNPSLPFTGNNSVFQFIDNISWIRGNHSMRMGAEIRRDEYNMIGTQEIRGSLNIDRPVTGYSFADYMLGMISGTRSAGALGEGWYRATSQAYFIQDTWRMRPTCHARSGTALRIHTALAGREGRNDEHLGASRFWNAFAAGQTLLHPGRQRRSVRRRGDPVRSGDLRRP